MLDDFVLRALLGGVGVAAIAGPLGCFVVWRRMAYFGNALAHSALLGIAVGVLLAVDLTSGDDRRLPRVRRRAAAAPAPAEARDRHACSASSPTPRWRSGWSRSSFFETLRVDLSAYLFGDVLAVGRGDLLWIFGGGARRAAGAARCCGRRCSTRRCSQELAQAEGVAVGAVQAVFMLLMALAVAIGMKIVGILLIVSLLIIPAAAARQLARSPEQMAAARGGRRRARGGARARGLARLGHAGRPLDRGRGGAAVLPQPGRRRAGAAPARVDQSAASTRSAARAAGMPLAASRVAARRSPGS